MSDADVGLRFIALAWALVVGLLVFLPACAIAWADRTGRWVRFRWPLTWLLGLYLLALGVLVTAVRR
jgi:hypothetical protein